MSSSKQTNPDHGGSDQKKWADTQDWEPYREIITELYITKKWKLQQVKDHMEQEYSFKAT